MSDINLSNAFNYAKDTFTEGKSQAKKAIKREIKKNDSGFSAKEKKEIATIVTHRRILNDMTQIFLWGVSSIMVCGHAVKEIAEIQRRCVALSKPDSPNVVHIQNDQESYSSFTFPGGSQNHAVSFECQRDDSGQHFFVIHNRGEAADDPEIHGSTVLNWPEGSYARTSVKIAVSLEELTNPEFLDDLMKAHAEPTMTPCYAAIKKHLLHYPPGQKTASNIIVSQDEIAFRAKLATHDALVDQIKALEKNEPNHPALQVLKETAKGMKPELNALSERLIQFDPAFHTRQSFGTCTESNVTGPEKAMASPQIRRELKLASINFLAQEVAHSRIIRPRHFRDRKTILQHHKFRQQQLSEKIAQNKP